MNPLLEIFLAIAAIGAAIWAAMYARFRAEFPDDLTDIVAETPVEPPVEPPKPPVQPVSEPVQPAEPPKPVLDFSTPKKAWKSTRIICDEMGLPLKPTVPLDGKLYLAKDIICATIMGESEFENRAVNKNPNSTDYGICQFNDGPPNVPPDRKWFIGPGKLFSSPQDVFDNPERAVRFMVGYWQRNGHLNIWYAYLHGRYKQFLPRTSRMWRLAE
jgi:hypothetical protein